MRRLIYDHRREVETWQTGGGRMQQRVLGSELADARYNEVPICNLEVERDVAKTEEPRHGRGAVLVA